MDAVVPQDVRRITYGQAVWSCPLDAGVKLRKTICAATVANKPDTPGRARSSRSNHRAGNADRSASPVVTTLVCFFHLQTRLRVRLAPGIPCALFVGGTWTKHHPGENAPRECRRLLFDIRI